MVTKKDRAEPGRAEHVCPMCKQPVETVVKRRKVLGAYVPSWVPGPCHQEDCSARADHDGTHAPHAKPTRSERLDRLSHS